MPDISVVFLSWDGLELTKRCVESLRDGTLADHEFIIVRDSQSSARNLTDRKTLYRESLEEFPDPGDRSH